MKLPLHVTDEVSSLETVILGIGTDNGPPRGVNPKAQHHIQQGTYPVEADLLREIGSFEKVLVEHGVEVLRPVNISNLLQIFTRDIGFVIGETFFTASMQPVREKEVDGIRALIDGFPEVVDLSKEPGVKMEGGDVLLRGDQVFVGLSARTNQAGFEFLKNHFAGRKEVHQIEVVVDADHEKNILHLDCTFQPVGSDCAIIYRNGIKNYDYLRAQLSIPDSHIYEINHGQFLRMFPNIFSLSKDTVIVEKAFVELKEWLTDKGFRVIDVDYTEVSKLSGLLRCSTLPLRRKNE